MKTAKLLLTTVMVFISAALFAQPTKTEKIKVYGNCAICKKNIESASKAAGVTTADWNKKTKWLTVSYNPVKVTNEKIQEKVAAAGYDTEAFKGNDKAYNNLDECCQYNRKQESLKKKN